jgi:hypothetical protein
MHLIPSLAVILLPPQDEIYSFILNLKGYSVQLMSLVVCIGLLRLRKQDGGSKEFRAWSIAIYIPMLTYATFLCAPLVPSLGESRLWSIAYALVVLGVLAVAVAYWYIRFHLLASLHGYRVETVQETLPDGTEIQKLVNVPDSSYEKVPTLDRMTEEWRIQSHF